MFYDKCTFFIDKIGSRIYNFLYIRLKYGNWSELINRAKIFMIVNLTAILYAAFALLCLLFYIPKLKQLFYVKHKLLHKTAADKRKISIVVPARDESDIIGDLFASIAQQDYDKDCFCVNVIVDSPCDATVEIAKSYGFKVFVVENQKCKGDALDGYFKAEDKRVFASCEAFVIVDADAVLTKNYLSELNNALEYDADIFLSRKHIKNFYGERRDRTVFTNCSALTYAQLDDLGNVYRTDHNMPLNMCGQGMMVRRGTIEKIGGWPYRTLTEDYEMRMDCYLKGFKSIYYPYAVICTEEPLKHGENFKRRLRWVTGYSQSDAIYKKKIRAQTKERGKKTAGEREYFYALAPLIAFAVITVLAVFCGIGLSVYGGVTHSFGWVYPLLMLIVMPLGVMYLMLFIYSVMCIVCMRDAFAQITVAERIFTVVVAPFYILEYVPIFIASRVKAKHGWNWKPTRHIRYKGRLRGRAKEEKYAAEQDNTETVEELKA